MGGEGEKLDGTFKSNMPGLGELSMSSPLAILKRAVVCQSAKITSCISFPTSASERRRGLDGRGGEGQGKHTIEVQQLLVGGLRSKLLGVFDGRLEVRHFRWLGLACLFGSGLKWGCVA